LGAAFGAVFVVVLAGPFTAGFDAVLDMGFDASGLGASGSGAAFLRVARFGGALRVFAGGGGGGGASAPCCLRAAERVATIVEVAVLSVLLCKCGKCTAALLLQARWLGGELDGVLEEVGWQEL
jgi:hypothetical protein